MMGSPGDFRFSDVPKPENYLHTYRDLHSREHVSMLSQLTEGTHRFLRSLFDESFMAKAQISAGFHYPVRTQYATLHMQLRVNSGSVCREDGRGIEVHQLIENLKRDRKSYNRDSETLRYHVTENVKVSLLAAANEYEEQNPGETACRQTSPLSWELGLTAMPTIHDEGEENEPESDTALPATVAEGDLDAKPRATQMNGRSFKDFISSAATTGKDIQAASEESEAPASYLVNLQPSPGSRFHRLIYQLRQRCADLHGLDPTHLYPLHVSVTGFFEAPSSEIARLVVLMEELLAKELSTAGRVTVGKVITTKTGYVLFDMQAVAIHGFSQRLGELSMRALNGVSIRPKAVNHISLACDRPDEEVRERIRRIYDPDAIAEVDPESAAQVREAYSSPSFDLVLSKLLKRSSFERMEEDGPHSFEEVARIPVIHVPSMSVPLVENATHVEKEDGA
mmetsp:Transcript_120231/g.268726  ORF Transcript_120231/g.268726 Transcript_120231/m.268726 type:complete len:452 (-) Transcript_120231:62-1417(-)